MDQNKLESLLTAINREQRLRSDLEVQVSHERQRLQVNNKYIATLMQEKVCLSVVIHSIIIVNIFM